MKRSPHLQPLSRDHHDALTAVVLVRRQLEGGAGPERLEQIAAEFVRFHQDGLLPHFRHEEEWLLPLSVPCVAEDDPMLRRLFRDHLALHRLVYDLEAAEEEAPLLAERLSALITRLEAHVRFEERELFPRLEAALPPARLEAVGRLLSADPRPALVIPGLAT